MNRTKKIAPFLIILFLALFLTIFSCSLLRIYRDVKINCLKAKNEYRENCVNSLIRTIRSEDKTLRQKNSAIWSLGQIADKKALPFLYELDKSLPEQEECRYDQYLCKYEVQKAIKWCEKGNITNWMYRGRENWQ